MNRTKTFLALVVVLSATTLFLALSPAGSQTPTPTPDPTPTQPPKGITLKFFEPNGTSTDFNLDLGKKGFSPGDTGTSKAVQLDPETCEKNALVVGQFTYLAPIGKHNGYFGFVGAALIKGSGLLEGKLMFQFVGQFEGDASASGAITGGTGPYKNAQGDVTLEDGVQACGKKGSLATVDLIQN
jgi:hypothetical protein